MELYITDLDAYNQGHLIGKWISLPMTETELSEAIEDVLCDGAVECEDSECHEEVFITDYDSDIAIGEYDCIYRLNELAQKMEEFTDDDLLKLKFLSHEGYDEREVIDNGIDTYDVDIYDYRGTTSYTDTFELLAQDFVEEGLFGDVPESLENYIDYEKIARDLRFDYVEIQTNVLARIA